HCPLTDRTRNLINKDAFDKMKKTAILINVARGPVVNNQDLYQALMEEKIMAAGLDVLEKEPMEPSNPLSQIKDSTKLIITPHMSWASLESRTRMITEIVKNIEAFLNGNDRNVINP
ncbi:MAG: hydroxyacid dehydrogenase, partial [Lachnospiraceae bacterium]|nr:hydroxyacid dehydrogenase [Lachnospiraceae bacterium]